MKSLSEFSKHSLSKGEMSFVKGGAMFNCSCGTGAGCNVGVWEGNYESPSQIVNAINTWCTCGGSCIAP
jgi:natural product precursor